MLAQAARQPASTKALAERKRDLRPTAVVVFSARFELTVELSAPCLGFPPMPKKSVTTCTTRDLVLIRGKGHKDECRADFIVWTR